MKTTPTPACGMARRRRAAAPLLAVLLALTAQMAAPVRADTGCARRALAYLGSDGPGLRALRLDACDGRLEALGVMAELPKARWALPHPRLPLLYVAQDGSGAEGRVLAYRVRRDSGALVPLGELASGGVGSTHLALDLPSSTLLVAHFGSGSVSSLALRPDGVPTGLVSRLQASGSGPHRRQASAHAHAVAPSPSGREVLVPDLGADRVFVYGLDRARQALLADAAATPRSLALSPGSGPRRAVFAPGGRFVYVLNELSAELMSLRWDAAQGRLTPLQRLPLSSPGFGGTPSAAELLISADGRHAYVANRGESELMVFALDPADGQARLLQRLPSGGDGPWAMDMDRSGRWLLVANHRSQRINLFHVAADSGLLSDTGQAIAAPAPVSVNFMN